MRFLLLVLLFFTFSMTKGLSQCSKSKKNSKKFSHLFFADWRRDTLDCKTLRKRYNLKNLLSESKYSDSKSVFFGFNKDCILYLLGKPDYPSANVNEFIYLLGKNCHNPDDKSFSTFSVEFKNDKVIDTFVMIYD
jgi:outer membrane protein assembly factor BamE (lipoprotein component of BamABCDE complex)